MSSDAATVGLSEDRGCNGEEQRFWKKKYVGPMTGGKRSNTRKLWLMKRGTRLKLQVKKT